MGNIAPGTLVEVGTNKAASDFTHGATTSRWRQSPPGGVKEMGKPLQENLTRQLHDSVERLQRQAEKVEFWASAVSGLAVPVPDYQPEDSTSTRYVKPGRLPRKRHRGRPRTRNKRDTKPASP